MLKKINFKYLKQIFIAFLTISFGIAMTFLISPIINAPVKEIFIYVFKSTIGDFLSKKINSLGIHLGYLKPSILSDPNEILLKNAELHVAKLKKSAAENKSLNHLDILAQELEKNVIYCKAILDRGDHYSSHYMNLYIDDMNLLMNVPTESLADRLFNYSDTQIEVIRKKMLNQARNLIAPYDTQSKTSIAEFISEILHRIAPETKNQQNATRVKPIFLNGPPGIGKTYLVRELAKIFNIPVCKVDMGNFDLDEFLGDQVSGANGRMNLAGSILKSLATQYSNPNGCKDLILLLDETDKAFLCDDKKISDSTSKLVGLLHSLLQVDNLLFLDHGYNIPLDISNLIVVCTGNRNCFADEALNPETRKSLLDRISVINMPHLSAQAKHDILLKHATILIQNDASTSAEQQKIIKELLEYQIDRLCDDDRNETSGLRSAILKLNTVYYNSYSSNLDEIYGCRKLSSMLLEPKDPMPKSCTIKVDNCPDRYQIEEKIPLLTWSTQKLQSLNKLFNVATFYTF